MPGAADKSDSADGPIDVTTDITHLNDRQQVAREENYNKAVVEGGKLITALGQHLAFDLIVPHKERQRAPWKRNGTVCVAGQACQRCKEVNTLRPKHTPPFVCLLPANTRYRCREDGTRTCAYCTTHGHKTGDCDAKRLCDMNDDDGSHQVVEEELYVGDEDYVCISSDGEDEEEDDDLFEPRASASARSRIATSTSGRKIKPVPRFRAVQNRRGSNDLLRQSSTQAGRSAIGVTFSANEARIATSSQKRVQPIQGSRSEVNAGQSIETKTASGGSDEQKKLLYEYIAAKGAHAKAIATALKLEGVDMAS